MPKLLICFSDLKKKDRKAATSSMNMKALIEERVAKEATDTTYTVITLNTKMKLANVVTLINGSQKKIGEHEDVISTERYTVDPSKTRGRWTIENLSEEPKKKPKKVKETEEAPKKKKKKSKD